MYLFHFYLFSYFILSFFIPLQAESWSLPKYLSSKEEEAICPQIVVDSLGNTTAIWENANDNHMGIQAAYKPVNENWQNKINLSIPNKNSQLPRLVVDKNGCVTAVWYSFSENHMVIEASSKPCQGNWQPVPDQISKENKNAFNPQLAVDPWGNVTVVWEQFNDNHFVILASTKPFGGQWQAVPNQVSSPRYHATSPNIVVDNFGNITVIWCECHQAKTIIRSSTKLYGENWPSTQETLSLMDQNALDPKIAVDIAGNLTAIWCIKKEHSSIVQVSIKPIGENWQSIPDDLSPANHYALAHQLAMNPQGNTFVVWYLFNGTSLVVQALSKPFRESWQFPPNTLSSVGVDSFSPQITVDELGNAIAIWYCLNKDNIHYSIQTSVKYRGRNWQIHPDNLLQGLTTIGPQIVVNDQGKLAAIWCGYDDTHKRIQYSEKNLSFSFPSSPSDFKGKVIFHHSYYIYHLRWKASADPSVKNYQLFRNGQLLAEIPANQPLYYKDRHHHKNKKYTYHLFAVNQEGEKSESLIVVLP